MKAELIPIDGSAPIPIKRDVTVLGRRDFCDVQIDDPSLSKRHCVLVKTDGLLIVRDLATTNGTRVKGQKIRWAALLPDDRIAFGAIKFRVYLGPDDIPSPSEMAARGLPFPAKPANDSARKPAAPPSPSPKAPPVTTASQDRERLEAARGGFEIFDDESESDDEIIDLD